MLTEPKLREFLKKECCDDTSTHRHAFMNFIQNKDNKHYLDSLIIKFKLIEKQLSYILHNYDIVDKRNFDLLKNIEIILLELKNLGTDSDSIKRFTNIICDIFAGWSTAGSIDYDIIEKIIEDI